MSCERWRLDLSAWIDGELPEARAAELARHLENCVGCRQAAEAAREVDRALRAVPLPELRPGARAELTRRIAADRHAAPRRRLAWSAAVAQGSRRRAAALAVVAAAVALYLLLPSSVGDSPVPEPLVADLPPEDGDDLLGGASDEELAIALELETVEDLEVIANLELLEAFVALEAESG